MQCGAGLEALHRAGGLAFFVGTQQIGGVVAQQICNNTDSALFVLWDPQLPRSQNGLFALCHRGAQVGDLQKLPGIVQAQLIAYFKGIIPAGSGDLSLTQELLIISGRCL